MILAVETSGSIPIGGRERPVTLIDGVHDREAQDYLQEAPTLLVTSGIFNPAADDRRRAE